MSLEPVNHSVVISGCSGGGKSTLLAELGKRNFDTVLEPGRRIVEREQLGGGDALPWRNAQAFLEQAQQLSRQDLQTVRDGQGWVFFDRGLVDAISGLASLLEVSVDRYSEARGAYHSRVFLTPPWPEIYQLDAQRQHGLQQAVDEYERLLVDFPLLGYEVVLLPKVSVSERADFVLQQLEIRR